MTRYARIADGAVVEFIETDGDITTMFHPSLIWLACTAAVELGWLFDGDGFVPPPPAAPLSKADLLAYAADKRFQVETGGIEVGGATLDTSRDSQAMITGAYTYSQANPAEIVKFKAASGWVDLNAATLATIATAVGAHVQACFAVEASVAAEIEAGTITTTTEINAADWPT